MTPEQAATDAGTTTLTERKVGEISGHFLVPSYQRGFRWGTHEVEQLLNDIRASEGSNYYLQPVVVRRGDESFELIDGQQRLTTLFLIHRYIKTHFPTSELEYSLVSFCSLFVFLACCSGPRPDGCGEDVDSDAFIDR